MSFEGYWSKGNKHGPGLLRVIVQPDDGTTTPSSKETELVFFEVWSKGNRLHRELLTNPTSSIPLIIKELPQYHEWKHIWESSENQHNSDEGIGVNSGSANIAVPAVESFTTSNLAPSSFCSYLNQHGTSYQHQRGRYGTKKYGFVILSTIRKKTRLSKLFSLTK